MVSIFVHIDIYTVITFSYFPEVNPTRVPINWPAEKEHDNPSNVNRANSSKNIEKMEWKTMYRHFQHLGGGEGDTPRPPYVTDEHELGYLDKISNSRNEIDTSAKNSIDNDGNLKQAEIRVRESETLKPSILSSPLLDIDVGDTSVHPDSRSTLTAPGIALSFEKHS